MEHKDLEAWKQAMDLVDAIYKITKLFPKEELFGLSAQMRRSAVSIPSNIAEGAARRTDMDFSRFLYISLGSLAELETQTIIAQRLGYMPESIDVGPLISSTRKLLVGLIKYLHQKQT